MQVALGGKVLLVILDFVRHVVFVSINKLTEVAKHFLKQFSDLLLPHHQVGIRAANEKRHSRVPAALLAGSRRRLDNGARGLHLDDRTPPSVSMIILIHAINLIVLIIPGPQLK